MKFLNIQTKSVSFASLILAGSYFLSAILGLLRDRLLAGRLGTAKLDVYYSAFTIPDFVALLLIFGAISAAIVPIFSTYLVKSKEDAFEYLVNLLNIFLSFLIVVCIIFIIFAPLLVNFVAPGFSLEKKEATVTLMRIMFLSPIILGISTIITGILQVFHRFLVTALAPIMYNIGIIIGILFFVPFFGLNGLAMGVVFGGILHLLVQIPAFLHSGFAYKLSFNLRHPGVIKTLKLMVPRSLGLGAGQFNIIVITAIASTLIAGSISIFNLANNLSAMMVNAIAASLSSAIFVPMSRAFAIKDMKDFEYKFQIAFLQIIFLTIPISILLFFLRAQIIRVLLGTGKFGWQDTRLTAACLGIFAIGLFGQGLIFLLSKTFYAAHNTKIPAWISFGTVIFNIIISLLFIWILNFPNVFSNFLHFILRLQDIENIRIVGLALAFTITAICEALILLFFVHRKLKVFRISRVAVSLYKIIISGSVMISAILIVRDGLVIYNIINLQTTLGVLIQLVLASIFGLFTYIFMSFLVKSSEIKMIKESFFTKFTKI